MALSNALQSLGPELKALVESAWKQLQDSLQQNDYARYQQLLTEAVTTELQKLLIASDYCQQVLQAFTAECMDFIASGDIHRRYDAGEWEVRLRNWLDSVDSETQLSRRLREFRRYEMLRIIWRDVNDLAALEETMQDLSAMADAALQVTLDFLYPRLVSELGEPQDKLGNPQKLIVIGMGKLGANELNLSSDIDLMFVFPTAGETHGGRRSVDNQQFFTRLGQRLIELIGKVTADGFVFRVDMRLRPYGQSGALAMNRKAFLGYYEEQGREWERYALVKARVVAGDKVQGADLLRALQPFVYRRYIDYGVIESLREMKQLINREAKRKGYEDNIKLGIGGIREIEFIAQVFQLIRGGSEPALRERSLLKVYGFLQADGMLPAAAVDELVEAYYFLRYIEHAIQAMADKQTQAQPREPMEQERIGFAMGFASWQACLEELDRHREKVNYHFRQLIADEAKPAQHSDADLELWHRLWQQALDPEQASELLQAKAYADQESLLRMLDALRRSNSVLHLQEIARDRLNKLMPLLLQAASRVEDPVQTMDRALTLVEAILRRSAYMSMLIENPQAIEQLMKLFSASVWIADRIAQQPVLLDELLDANALYSPPGVEELEDELRQQLMRIPEDELEAQMYCLRNFRQAHALRVAASEIAATLPLMKVSDYLTWLAESVLDAAFKIARQNMVSRYGMPRFGDDGEGEEVGFVVIGYGKLGGIELSYASDLDLIFLHDNAPQGRTDGEKPQDVSVFFARLVQRIIHVLTTRMTSGDLYEVDLRLRPSGNSGLLATSLNAFEKYQQDDAWTWEHQALVRARAVAGSAAMKEKFARIRAQILCRQRDPEQLKTEVLEMREKMKTHLGSDSQQHRGVSSVPGHQFFNLKQDTGGIVDIEFMVQYGVLRWAHKYPDLATYTDNIRILEGLTHHGLLPEADATRLREAYIAYRAAVHRRNLLGQKAMVEADPFVQYRADIQAIWQRWLMEGQ